MPNLLGLIRQGNNNGSLEDIGQLIQLVNQQNQNKGIPTENIGGYNIPINRGRQNPFSGGLNALSGLTQGYSGMRQMNKRNQFLQGVQKIAQFGKTPDEKINALVALTAQHGTDYGLGVKDIITQYGQMVKSQEWKPTTKEEALEFEQTKTGMREWKPTTKEEAFELEREKAGIKKGAGKTLTSPMIDNLSKKETAVISLADSFVSLEGNKDRFSQFMGPAKGALRNPIRAYVNKDLQDFLGWKANVQDAFQQYRVAVTGAQASDKEIALLAKNRPTENDSYEVFVRKTKEVQRIGKQVLQRYINNMGKAGYDVSGYQNMLDNLGAGIPERTAGTGSNIQNAENAQDEFQIGQTTIKNGKTYTYIGNNQWSY